MTLIGILKACSIDFFLSANRPFTPLFWYGEHIFEFDLTNFSGRSSFFLVIGEASEYNAAQNGKQQQQQHSKKNTLHN